MAAAREPFRHPDFRSGSLELRFDDNEVCIYGTKDGLMRFARICLDLAGKVATNGSDHAHLEDRDLLTSSSLRGVVAVFGSAP